jgi:two-component system cell cycle sensor histidine kinase/response regulator CckA
VLDHSAQMFGRTKKEINIHTDFAPDLRPVEIDRRQMEQVFLNLFVNAWHAMPGGGKLIITTTNVFLDEAYVEPHGVVPGRYVKISVTDTGTGIDEATLKKIFDPFFTTREMGRGSGLGLAMVYGIVKNHEGLVAVHSEVGKGSTFTICLPLSNEEIVPETTDEERKLPGSETVLLVDDEAMITEVGEKMLAKLGYRVYAARGGKEAVELFRKNHKDIKLVIMDMIMPDMSGGETFDRLREIQSDVMVLLSSGYSLDAQAQAILNRGCKGFIQKPFNMNDLSREIRKIFDKDR